MERTNVRNPISSPMKRKQYRIFNAKLSPKEDTHAHKHAHTSHREPKPPSTRNNHPPTNQNHPTHLNHHHPEPKPPPTRKNHPPTNQNHPTHLNHHHPDPKPPPTRKNHPLTNQNHPTHLNHHMVATTTTTTTLTWRIDLLPFIERVYQSETTSTTLDKKKFMMKK